MPTDRVFVAALALVVSVSAGLAAHREATRQVPALELVSDDTRLIIEVLDDGLIHFEFAPKGAPPRRRARIVTTPMVLSPRRAAAPRKELETLLTQIRSCKPTTHLSEARGVEAVLKLYDVRRTDERE